MVKKNTDMRERVGKAASNNYAVLMGFQELSDTAKEIHLLQPKV